MSSSRAKALSCRVHPLAIASILDAFIRRPEGAEMSLGTLMGYIDGTRLVISDAFTVLHKENDVTGTLSLDKEYHKKMVALKKKVVPTESVIGWFSTSGDIEPSFVAVHSFYGTPSESKFVPSQLLPSPVLLTIDPILSEGDLNIRVSIMQPTVGADSLIQFHQLSLESDMNSVTAAVLNKIQSDSELLSNQVSSDVSEDLSLLMNQVDAEKNGELASKVSMLIQTLNNSASKIDRKIVDEIRALAKTHQALVEKVSGLLAETPEIVI